MIDVLKHNPFAVLTPDDQEVEITNSETIHRLFVNVFEDFTSIPQQGHVFINGPRGSGKSMMFRFMLPDCQLIHNNVDCYNKLPYFSIHIPIKLTSINNPEFELLKNYGTMIFSEHVLTLYLLDMMFDSFTKLNFGLVDDSEKLISELSHFFTNSFLKKLKLSGWKQSEDILFKPTDPKAAFVQMKEIIGVLFANTLTYLRFNAQAKKYPGEFTPITYSGPLCDYLNFLFPLIKDLKEISIFPKNKPFFLLIDDADNLTESQTIVLNTWVSYRTNTEVSLKISTQLKYKTYNTLYRTNIDSPHDYYDINIQTTYSSSKDTYNKRVRQIVEKRLEHFFFNQPKIDPDNFFPADKKQESLVAKEKEKIRRNYKKEGKGFRTSDDVSRYAVPNFIRSLSGSSKSVSSFSYSGFDQLVSISSGIIRFFLTPAAKMFNAAFRDLRLKNENGSPQDVKYIEPSIQNRVVKDFSASQLFEEYEKLKKDRGQIESDEHYLTKIEKLRNLIEGIGTIFHEYLISKDRTERRFFSFALSDKPDSELQEILQLGIEFGYFQLSSIGKKRGSGRTKLYILSRILAPYFKLDPTSFAGYKFFTSAKLKLALKNPDSFREMLKKVSEKDEEIELQQQKIDF